MNNNRLTRHERTISLIGNEAFDRIHNSVVAVVGLGGVGGYAAEALARSGVGTLLLIDGDSVDATNLNRQIFATDDNIGNMKALVAKDRLLSINPELNVYAKPELFKAENAGRLLNPRPYVILDAIDSIAHKIALIEYAHQNGIRIISAGGAGNRLSPEGMCCVDVFDTSGDPLCRIMRRELKKRGIVSHSVVCVSKSSDITRNPSASMVFVPGSMGLMMAQQAISSIMEGDCL